MSQAFNLTAQINLQAPSNLKTVVAQIRRELGTVSADVKINISGQSARTIDNITRRLDAMNAVLVQARTNTSSLDTALRSLSTSFSSLQSSSSKTTSSLSSTTTTVKETAKNLRVATTEMEEFGKQSALAIRRFAAFSVVTTGVFALTNAITSGFKAFVEFDQELVKLQQVTGKGVVGLRGLEKEITVLATSLGVSSKSLVEVASTLAQAGLSAEDTRVALSALAKTELAPSFDSLTDTTEGAIAALRQFGLQAKDLEKALGSINAVAAAFAVESKDIIAAIQRTGGVFAAASRGVSEGTDALNEFVAVFTSVRATTRESAETIATGLRTIFTRIQRAKTIDQLKEFGVELTDLEGKFVGPFEAVKRLSQALNQLDPRDLRFSSIVEELGGFRQIGKVIPLIQQFATAQEALKVAQKGQGSLTEAQITAQKSLANQLAKVREQFLALIRDIGKSQTFQGLFKVVTGLASGLISLAGAFKPILPILAIMGAVKGVSAITQFASGFAGGIKRGGGIGSVGSNIGETLSGAKDKEKNDTQQKANTLIAENTSAIKTLTTAMNSLISNITENTRALASSNSQTLNSGGVVRKFARGGLVPGSGNGDTVPAMLEPGEFVIRKKAVETIGASNLQRVNKFAAGGMAVQDVDYKRTRDGDSLIVDYTPKAQAFKTSTRLIGYDAYEINKGTKEERAKGEKAKQITEDWAANQSKKALLQKFEAASGKKDKFGRPMFDAPRLGQRLVAAGVAVPYSGEGEKATGSGGFGDMLPGEYSMFYDKKNLGGLIKKLATGGAITDQDTILQQIEKLGGIKGVKSALGLSGGDRTADSLLRASNIKAGRNLPQAQELVKKALATLQEQGIIRAKEIDKATKVGIVGLQPFDKVDEEGPLQLGAKNVMVYIRGLSSKFSDAVSKMRDSVSSVVRNFAGNLQDTSIFGDNKPLRLDFDETLVSGADIFNSAGEIDIAGYSNLDRVKEGLEKGVLTQLGEKVKELLQIDPKFIDRISVLTARPQSNAKLLSQKLNQLGLPISADKIVGTSGSGAAKANQLKQNEKLIDDNISNILAAKKQGKDAYQYGEIRDLSDIEKSATGFANIEGSVLEATLAALGAKPGSIQNRAIDYPDGLGRAAQLFPGIDPSWPTEVKRTLDSGAIGRAKEEFASAFAQTFKLGGKVYNLQKASGLSNAEFDELVKFGNTNDFSEAEFKDYLSKYLARKTAKKDLMINSEQLRQVLLSGTRTSPASQKQMDLARQLMGSSDAQYNPKYDNARRPFALGGSVEDTVPALLTPGEFVINKKAAQKIGYGQLHKMNKADKIQGYNRGGIVGSIQRFVEGGEVSGVSEKNLQSILRVLVAQEKNSRTSSGQKLISQIEDIIAGQANGIIEAKDAIIQVATGLRSFAIENKQAGNDDRADSLKNIFQALDKLQQSRGGTASLIGVTNDILGIKSSKQASDQFSAFRGVSGGSTPDLMGPRSPFPDDLMGLTTAAKAATEAQNNAAEQAEYFAAKAKESGQSLAGYAKTLATKVVDRSNSIVNNLPNKKQDLRLSAIGVKSKLDSEDAFNKAVESFTNQLVDIDPDAAEQNINLVKKAAEDLAKAMQQGDSFEKAKANSKELADILKKTYTEAEATEKAFKDLADETGFTSDQLKKLVGPDNLRRQQFIQSEQGQKFGKLAEIAPDMVQRFAGTRAGAALGKASDFASGKGLVAAVSKKFGDDIGKSLDKWLNRLGGPMGVLGAGLAILGDKLPSVIESMGMGSSTSAAAVAGGIRGAGQGLASGAVLGGQIAGPVGALIAGITGAVVGGISGAFDAYNDKKLENTLKTLDKTSTDLDIAFKKLESSFSEANFADARAKLGADVAASATLADQANLGSSGLNRTIVDVLRMEPTGLINSITGGNQEKEARQALVKQIGIQLSSFEKLGSIALSRVSTNSIEKFLDSVPKAPERKTGETDAQYEENNKKVLSERRLMLARGSQTYQQMSDAGYGEEDIFINKYIDDQSKKGKTEAEISKAIAENRQQVIDTGRNLLAGESEIAAKQELLTRISKDLAVATEQIIDVYRRAQASLNRYGQELSQFQTDTLSRVNDLTGNASIKSPTRMNERVLGNISAYSRDEVEQAAIATNRLAGGGDSGNKLQQDIMTAKILQDELPKALRGATQGPEGVNEVISTLEQAFKNAKVNFSPAIQNQLREAIESKTAGRQDGQGIGLSELADDPSILNNLLKGTEAGLKFAQEIQAKYNDTISAATDLMNKYNDVLSQAEEYQRKATDIRLNAELDLAKALGKSPTLNQLNKPFDTEIKGLTKSVIPGGSTDPNRIAAELQNIDKSIADSEARLNNPTMETYGAKNQAELDAAIGKDIQALGKQKKALNDGTKALEKLANDGTKAANALSKIQSRQQTSQNAVNIAQKLLTSDETELADFTRQMQAYTKTIGGGASREELGSLQFRRDAFSGLENIKSVLPDSIAKQMQATLTRQMLSANPEGNRILQQQVGLDEDGKPITLDQALSNVEGGKLDPVQQQQIEAYNAAVQAQVDAANALGDRAVQAADILAMNIDQLMGDLQNGIVGMISKLQEILPKAEAEAQATPKPQKQAEEPKDEMRTDQSKNDNKKLKDASAGASIISILAALVLGGAGLKIGAKLLPRSLTEGISSLNPFRKAEKPAMDMDALTRSGASVADDAADAARKVKPSALSRLLPRKYRRAAALGAIAAGAAGTAVAASGSASGSTTPQEAETPTTTESVEPIVDSGVETQAKEARSAILDGVQTVLSIAGLFPLLGEAADLANAAVYSARAAASSDPSVRNDLLIDSGLSAAAAIPVGGYSANAVQAGRLGIKAGKAVSTGVGIGTEVIVKGGLETAADQFRPPEDAVYQGVPTNSINNGPAGPAVITSGVNSLPEQVKTNTETTAASLDDSAQVESPELDTIAAMAKKAMTPGSIYTHDIHSVEILNKILATLSQNNNSTTSTEPRKPDIYEESRNADQAFLEARSKIQGAGTAAIMGTPEDLDAYQLAEKRLADAKTAAQSATRPAITTDQPIIEPTRTSEQQKAIDDKIKADKEFADKFRAEYPEDSATANSIQGGRSALELRSARGEQLSELQQRELEEQRRDEYFRRRHNGERDLDWDQMIYARQQRALDYENRQNTVTTNDTISQSKDPTIEKKDGKLYVNSKPYEYSSPTSADPLSLTTMAPGPQTTTQTSIQAVEAALPQFNKEQQKRLTSLTARGKARASEDGFRIGRTPEQEAEYQELRKLKLDSDPVLKDKMRLGELKRKGKLRASSEGLPIGRSPEEEQEYKTLVANKPKTPYEQMQLSKREAYLSRLNPETRARMEKKLGISSQDNQNPMTAPPVSTGPVPTSLSTQQVVNDRTSGTPGDRMAADQTGSGYTITIDESSRQFLEAFSVTLNSFGSYIDKLSAIQLPDSITMKGEHVVDVRISGAAAFEGLKKDFMNMMQVEISNKMAMIWKQTGGKVGEAPTNTIDSNAGSIGQGMV